MLKSSKAKFLCKDAKNPLGRLGMHGKCQNCRGCTGSEEKALSSSRSPKGAKNENEGNRKRPSRHESRIELLKDDVANSYLEQVVVVYPYMDLSLMDPCKDVVNGKLM
ncbi:hypothetical protein ACSQ67_014643 [Phaseolus vulgaris]